MFMKQKWPHYVLFKIKYLILISWGLNAKIICQCETMAIKWLMMCCIYCDMRVFVHATAKDFKEKWLQASKTMKDTKEE